MLIYVALSSPIVTEANPIKQGLKLGCAINSLLLVQQVTEANPIKQGLKPLVYVFSYMVGEGHRG